MTGTFTRSGEPPASTVWLRAALASALLTWAEDGRGVGGITEVSSMWEKMQAGGKVGGKSLSKGEIHLAV